MISKFLIGSWTMTKWNEYDNKDDILVAHDDKSSIVRKTQGKAETVKISFSSCI